MLKAGIAQRSNTHVVAKKSEKATCSSRNIKTVPEIGTQIPRGDVGKA